MKLSSRGLTIGDYKVAKQYLYTNNYYNVINGYSKYFIDSNTSLYYKDSNFDEITHLYFFDSEIKSTLLKSIIQAENHLKYITAHKFAKYTKGERYPYLNVKNYNPDNILYVGDVISNFSTIIKKHNKKDAPNYNNPIKHYVRKHDDVPIWVIIEYLDMGGLYYFIRNLPTSLVNEISKSMLSFLSDHTKITCPLTPETLLSFVDNLRQVRNVCAHGNRLINFQTKQNIKFYSNVFDDYSIRKSDERKKVFHIFIILRCFLSETQFKVLHNTFRSRMKYLDNKLTSISINDILEDLGFPRDWHLINEKLKQ